MRRTFVSIITIAVLGFAAALSAEDIELIPYGNFTKVGKEEIKQHWHGAGFAGTEGNTIEWISSGDGRLFARITADSEPAGRSHYICVTRNPIQINATWTELQLKAVYRVHDVRPLPASWQNFRFSLTWYDDMGNNVTPSDGSNFFFKESATTGDWKVGDAKLKKPANATSFKIDFGSQGGALIADVAQISLKPVGVSVESSPIPTL